MAAPIFIKGIKEAEDNKIRKILQGRLEIMNPEVRWGRREASFYSLGGWNRRMKAMVSSIAEALRVIKEGVLWEGKKLSVELWRPVRKRSP